MVFINTDTWSSNASREPKWDSQVTLTPIFGYECVARVPHIRGRLIVVGKFPNHVHNLIIISRPPIMNKTVQIHPRFMVFPQPFGFTSVNRAHSSSFNLFSSLFSSPNRVPSCSESTASCSDVVGASCDAGLVKETRNEISLVWISRNRHHTYPPPLMNFPLFRSSSRYSSMVIVGNR